MVKNPDVRELLTQSLLELLDTEPIQNISVRAIADNCSVSTRTFYNHFFDKHDLVNYVYCTMNESCWFENGRKCSLEEFLTNWAHQSSTTYRNFFINTFTYHGQNDIRESIHKKGVRDLARLLEWTGYADVIDEQVQSMLSFYMYGLISTFEEGLRLPEYDFKKWSNQRGLIYLPKPIYEYLSAEPIQ